MHSWRVLILPYLEHAALYKEYDFSEPWDGPKNRTLSGLMPQEYRCPEAKRDSADNPPTTSYVVVTGPDTAFPGCKSRRLKEITDPREDTVLLVEVADSDIPWMEPRDPGLEDLAGSRGSGCQPFRSRHAVGADYWHHPELGTGNVACADGSAHFLGAPLRGGEAKAILSVAGGERFMIEDLADKRPLAGALRWDHIIGLPLFLGSLVALLVFAVTTRRKEGGHSCPPQTGSTGRSEDGEVR